jgi:hypothetical protein
MIRWLKQISWKQMNYLQDDSNSAWGLSGIINFVHSLMLVRIKSFTHRIESLQTMLFKYLEEEELVTRHL